MENVEPDSDETLHLLERIRAGDRDAFDPLFAKHRADLRDLVELRLDPKLCGRLDPSDIVQDAQLEAVRRLDKYLERPPMPFRLWLRQIAHDRLLMARRRHVEAAGRAVRREVALPDRSSRILARELLAAGSTPSQHVSRREVLRHVHEGMARLPEPDREILLMRNVEGLAFAEIACLLEVEPAAARKRYGRALLRLRTLLFEGGLTDSSP